MVERPHINFDEKAFIEAMIHVALMEEKKKEEQKDGDEQKHQADEKKKNVKKRAMAVLNFMRALAIDNTCFPVVVITRTHTHTYIHTLLSTQLLFFFSPENNIS